MYFQLIIIAVFPGIALAMAAYLTDRFDREPVGLLFKVFCLGALSVVPAAIIEGVLSKLNIFSGVFAIAYTSFIVAGFTEEMIKRGVVMKFAITHPSFDEKLDGIIYAIFASLGFATVENVVYVVFRFATNPYVGLSRGIFSVPAHMMFAITMGYYLSLSKFCIYPKLCKMYYRKALTVPMILHGIFDFILMYGNGFVFLAFIPFVIYLWITNLRKLNIYYIDSKNRVSNSK
jgi:RsiW-degrading membrane proteinase PrsW (M82 family)